MHAVDYTDVQTVLSVFFRDLSSYNPTTHFKVPGRYRCCDGASEEHVVTEKD